MEYFNYSINLFSLTLISRHKNHEKISSSFKADAKKYQFIFH